MAHKPLFIVFDGMDGTGKTTQMHRLRERLEADGIPTVLTAEPTDSEDGRRLRRALAGAEPAGNSRLGALFLLDRIGHNEQISAWLAEGKTVICDRYYYASMAYQGVGGSFDWVASMNLDCPDIRRPDGCILLDMEPAESMARIHAGRSADSLEIYETVAQQTDIRARFVRIAEHLTGREPILFVNAAGTPDEVTERVLAAYRTIAQAAAD